MKRQIETSGKVGTPFFVPKINANADGYEMCIRDRYKEYIEQWIHEIKTPITAMKLLCENHRTNWTKELLLELEKTNRFTEQALYYARSEHTEKDYSVREMALSQVCLLYTSRCV